VFAGRYEWVQMAVNVIFTNDERMFSIGKHTFIIGEHTFSDAEYKMSAHIMTVAQAVAGVVKPV